MTTSTKIDIESLVKMELPPLPSAALRVASLVQDYDSSTRAIADAIGSDPAIAARILRTANSSLYALERRVTALPMAVNTLGNQSIYMMVMVSAAADSYARKGGQSSIERSLWEHSLAVGLAAREISLMLGLRGGEEAFLCGLLHDIGKLMLLRNDKELYAEALESADEGELLRRETKIYGYTHTQVGALVARRWNLPEEVNYVILNHHHPSEAGLFMLLARLIDVADGMANKAGVGLRHEPETDLSTSESVIALNLSDEQLQVAWEKTEVSLREMIDLFK